MEEQADKGSNKKDDSEKFPKSDLEKEKITKMLLQMFVFQALEPDNVASVVDAMKPIKISIGQIVVKEGEEIDLFYVVDCGKFDVIKANSSGGTDLIGRYENSGYFGDCALYYKNHLNATTVIARTEGLLWAIDNETFDKVLINKDLEKRQMYMELLEGVEQFKYLNEREKMKLTDAMKKLVFKNGDVIKKGDEKNGMFFVIEGSCKVIRQKCLKEETTEEEIAQIRAGQFFGEDSLICNEPQIDTVLATEDTSTIYLDIGAFERLVGPFAEIINRHSTCQ